MFINANSAAISSNMNAISTNSQEVYDIQNTDGNCINDFDIQTGEYCGEWAGAKIQKLPLWGE